MFIITGNNNKSKEVKILDTTDRKEEWVSYEILQKGLKNGLVISGLDNRGNIMCQSLDVYKEIIKKSVQIIAKITLLRLDKINQLKLFLNLLEPYGLAQTTEDIQYSTVEEVLVLKSVNKCLDLQMNYVKNVSIGAFVNSNAQLDMLTTGKRLLVLELNKMIFDTDDTEIHYIYYIPDKGSHFCIIGSRLYEVRLVNYPICSSLEDTLQKYCRHGYSGVYYEMYIEDAWHRRANALISKMELKAEAAEFNQEVYKKMLRIIENN